MLILVNILAFFILCLFASHCSTLLVLWLVTGARRIDKLIHVSKRDTKATPNNTRAHIGPLLPQYKCLGTWRNISQHGEGYVRDYVIPGVEDRR